MEIFHSKTCTYCHKLDKFVPYLQNKYPELIIIVYDVSKKETISRYERYTKKYDICCNLLRYLSTREVYKKRLRKLK